MANPTLVGEVTPYAGFTVVQICERALAPFGLTEDSTTGRTVASAEESAFVRVAMRRAVSQLNGKFPSIFSIRTITGTWTAGDHSIALPASCRSVLYVTFDGLPLEPINRDDELRNMQANLASGASAGPKTGSTILCYRTTGYTSANLLVLRIYDTPTEAKTYEICYNTLAAALTSDSAALSFTHQFQEWILSKMKEILASEWGDTAQKSVAMVDLKKIEDELIPETEAMQEIPHKLKWKFPGEASKSMRRLPRP